MQDIKPQNQGSQGSQRNQDSQRNGKQELCANNLDFFFRFSIVISSHLKLDKLLVNVLDEILCGMNIQGGMIKLFDKSGKRLFLKKHNNIPKTILQLLAKRQVDDDPLALKVIATGVPLVETSNQALSKTALSKTGEPCSVIYCPLKTNEKIPGIMVLYKKGEYPEFTSNDMVLLKGVSRMLGDAIKHVCEHEEILYKVRELKLLQKINTSLHSAVDLKQVLKTIVGGMVKVFGYKGSFIFLKAEESDEILILEALSFNNSAVEKVEELIGGSIQGRRFKIDSNNTLYRLYSKKPPLLSNDICGLLKGVVNPKKINKLVHIITHILNIRFALLVPLVVGEKSKGTLVIVGADELDNRDIIRVQSFATQAAMAIEKARTFEEESRQRQVNETLYKIAQVVDSTLELDEVLCRILEELKKVINYNYAATLLTDEEQGKLSGKVFDGLRKETREISLPLDNKKGVTVYVAGTGEPEYVPNITKDKRYISVGLKQGSELAVPIKIKDKIIGVLNIESEKLDAFNKDDLTLLTTFANHVAVAIENALLYGKVKKSEERFSNVTTNIGDWIWEVDAEARYIYSSPVVAQILGYSPQEMLGKQSYGFICPEERENVKKKVQQMFKRREPVILINRNLHKDGHTVVLETSGTPVVDLNGQLLGYQGVNKDITLQVKAEEALAASEYRYRTLVEHSNDWIWTLDINGKFTFFNKAAEDATGYKYKDWAGRNFTPLILPFDLPASKRILVSVLKGEPQKYEVHIYKKDGKLLALAVNTAPLYEGEKIVGTVSMGRDVTEQKQLETRLRHAQKMESLGTLAGGIAHDFNNILSGILGFASLIKSKLSTDASVQSEVNTIISSAHRAAELTDQLLAFARGGRYRMQPININSMIEEVVKLLSCTIDKSIVIKKLLKSNLSVIEGDSGQIQQMLMNLCLNARDAMPGGGQLLIEIDNITIDDKSARTLLGLKGGMYVVLSVSDTGMGVENNMKERIFDPFFTTKVNNKEKKHSGLGLSMVFGIIQSHKGTIKVHSEVGKGATFKIYLPSTKREVIKKNSEPIVIKGGEETVLVVDDEVIIRKLTKRILNRAGYKVLLTKEGIEACELFSNNYKEIDLVILDMIMPGMDGMETYERLKQINPDIKVLLSSGYSKNEQTQELLDAGVQGFLQKPYEIEQMLYQIRRVLNK